jgi:hypothetical protein
MRAKQLTRKKIEKQILTLIHGGGLRSGVAHLQTVTLLLFPFSILNCLPSIANTLYFYLLLLLRVCTRNYQISLSSTHFAARKNYSRDRQISHTKENSQNGLMSVEREKQLSSQKKIAWQ